MAKSLKILLLLVLLLNLPQIISGQTKQRAVKIQPKPFTAEQIAKKFLPSVVLIVCDEGKGRFSQGSAFFIRPGQILTNNHVVKNMIRGVVRTVSEKQSKEWLIDKILFQDEKNDLALLSLEMDDKEKTASLKLPESKKISVGETVYVLSNPKGLLGTISQGIVSSEIRKVENTELLQIDAPISAGSSGGPVLDTLGEVIGVATASLSNSQNLNFAIPFTSIKAFLSRKDASLTIPKGISDSPQSEGGVGYSDGPSNEKKASWEETTEWITAKLGKDKINLMRIDKMQFSPCKMDYAYSYFPGEPFPDFQYSYTLNLNYLVKASEAVWEPFDVPNDVVALEFNSAVEEKEITLRNGRTTAEKQNNSPSTSFIFIDGNQLIAVPREALKEESKKNLVLLVVKDAEFGKRVAKAFTRLAELCAQKEPF